MTSALASQIRRGVNRQRWCGPQTNSALRSKDSEKGLARQAGLIPKKALGEPFRIRQCDEVATWNFLHLLSEPFTRNTPLKFDREKAVVSSRKNMNGDVGPALEATGLTENGLGFLAWLFRAGAQHVLRHVVQKVRSHVEFRRIAATRRSLFSRFDRSGCAPPCTSGLSGLWDHRVDEQNHPRAHARKQGGP